MSATLFAIGVGPGAPDLLTLRAIKALKQIKVILAAKRSGNEESMALNIAKPYLAKDVQIVNLDFPMTKDETILNEAWEKAARTTLEILAQDLDAAFLTLGDPLIYSTFSYLLDKLKQYVPDLKVKIIPGITSFQAASAKLEVPLCLREENLHIISGINSPEVLEQELNFADTAVILKVYRNFANIQKALEKTGRTNHCFQASLVEQPQETLQTKLDLKVKPPYMTLIISKKS
ncbi:MAG: precorrin-2 C(20)-methyltransferase [Desulfovibrionaceae bacterium]|nr:precorrin-2 C(20)-methyltransferase [Desulfovibrionaceae bacterium]